MKRLPSGILIVLLLLSLGLATFGAGFVAGRRSPVGARAGVAEPAAGPAFSVIRRAYRQILGSSIHPPAPRALARGAVRGMIRVLKRTEDPYALFFTPPGYERYLELTSGRFSGIGVWISSRGRAAVVGGVLPGSPAEAEGLEVGDRIIAVDGARVARLGSDGAVARIKGPEGTKVELTLVRGGRTLSVTIERRSLVLPNLQSSVVGGDVGYIELFGFARGAGNEVRKVVDRFVDDGVEGIVLDVRGNPGGLFSEAIEVAGVFIEDGEIVRFHARGRADRSYEAKGDAFEDVPLVVLIDGGSASAAEIVAGALKDRNRATLVGTRTFGKGAVQQVMRLGGTSVVKLSTGVYLTPRSGNIDGEGIAPDIEVTDPIAQRRRALALIRAAR